MGKPSGGSGGLIFTTNKTDSGSVGTSLYIDLGIIPTNVNIWFGNLQATSIDKSLTFEVRTSNAGKNSGIDSDTTLLASIVASVRNGTVLLDMYKNNRLHSISVLGSGVEHFWLKLKSKTASPGDYLYSINYTTE
jgi:hypothetical protein